MGGTALAFLAALDSRQVDDTLYPFARATREDWDYRPRNRRGLPLRAMSEAQRAAAWRLVDAALSEEGAAKARGVLALEAILQERTANKAYRDPLNYALAIFGRPGDGPWAWRFEGHHVSLTLTVVPGIGIAVTPHFFGANPFSRPVVPDGHGGLARVLESESALAFEIVGGLGAPELTQMLIAPEAPPDFLTGPGRERSLPEPVGLPLDAMPESQRARAIALIEHFFDHLHADLAAPIKRRTARGRHRRHPLRLGWRHHAGPAALLPAARADAADRVRPDRRRPRPLGLARPDQPFRRGPSARPSRGGARRAARPAAPGMTEKARVRKSGPPKLPDFSARASGGPPPIETVAGTPGSIIGPICSPLTPSACDHGTAGLAAGHHQAPRAGGDQRRSRSRPSHARPGCRHDRGRAGPGRPAPLRACALA